MITDTPVELSPWPMTVTVAPDVLVVVTGLSGNCYVITDEGRAIGLESPTVASETSVEAELPALYAAFKEANP